MPDPTPSQPGSAAPPAQGISADGEPSATSDQQPVSDDAGARLSGASATGPAAARRARRWTRRLLRSAQLLTIALLLLATALALIDLWVSLSTRDAIATSLDEVAPAPVALILGTARTHRGKPNHFYQARIEAAAALYHQRRVRGILVSGDNATRHYNEPIAMQKDLMALGVPAEYITLDYAGFRTLDSVVRAKKVFGMERVLVVSQQFHVARAIFLARHYGLEARGFAAKDPPRSGFLRIRAREVLARAAAILDIVTGQGPRFLGKHETVRLRGEPHRDLRVPQQS